LISNIISKEATSVDINEISNVEASISSIVATVASNDESSSNQLQTSKVNDDFITTPNASKKGRKKGSLNKEPSKQRKKSAQHLVKLLKKKQRKKRKLSSDEEEEDDSADDFELTSSAAAAINAAVMKSSSTASVCEQTEGPIDTNTSSQAASIMTDPNANVDEQTAKLLQANEKRRSVRAAASKRQKYVDDIDFKLTVDKADESGGDEQNQQVASGNPAFAIITNDALVVDKILGNRTIKRKIKIQKKIEKEKKTKCDIINNEAKTTIAEETTKMEIEVQETIVVEIVDTEYKTEKVSEEENKTLEEEKKQEEIEVSESEYEEVDGDEEEEVEEFFVKYKALSYLHCEWRTRDELVLQDKRIDQKIKRFKLKKAQANIYNDSVDGYEEELFNPDYVEVDRILDFYETADLNNELIKYYLVKWKTLAYEESTWELEKDISKAKIERYFKFNTIPTDTRIIPRPKADKWNCQTESRIYKNGNGLREYQLEGINWLTFCWLNGRNCILADEMGLGKTIQSITFLQEIAYYGIRGPFLVIVPLSTIGNWSREFETWTDFNIIVYHGSSQSRALIQDYEFYYKDDSKRLNKNFPKFNALITTYEVLLSDVTMFCQFKWRSLIIDEAHRLKNKNCKLIEGLRCMDVEHKVLLTGTPLQNNVEELFSLLNYLEPTQFHSSYEFMQEFGDLKTDTQVTKLQAILKPMMLRRLKEDVEKNLAPKEETIIEVELTNIQKKYYRAILEKNFQFLARGTAASNMPNLMNTMMELRKCCNHPYLINGKYFIIVF
jgi:chromodomain-helicase-DNA-binding protein 7